MGRMRAIGKGLQILGLVMLPAAMLLELTKSFGHSFGLKEMLLMLLLCFAAFYLGRYLEGYAQRA